MALYQASFRPGLFLASGAAALVFVVAALPIGAVKAQNDFLARRVSDDLCAGSCRLAAPHRGNDEAAHAPDGSPTVVAVARRVAPLFRTDPLPAVKPLR